MALAGRPGSASQAPWSPSQLRVNHPRNWHHPAPPRPRLDTAAITDCHPIDCTIVQASHADNFYCAGFMQALGLRRSTTPDTLGPRHSIPQTRLGRTDCWDASWTGRRHGTVVDHHEPGVAERPTSRLFG